MGLIKVTLLLDKDDWEKFGTFNSPGHEHLRSASFHVREAMRLYRKVMKEEQKMEEEREKDEHNDEHNDESPNTST